MQNKIFFKKIRYIENIYYNNKFIYINALINVFLIISDYL